MSLPATIRVITTVRSAQTGESASEPESEDHDVEIIQKIADGQVLIFSKDVLPTTHIHPVDPQTQTTTHKETYLLYNDGQSQQKKVSLTQKNYDEKGTYYFLESNICP